MITCSMPAATASSTAYWMTGLSTSGSISFGCAFVAGRNRVPQPAAGNTAFRTRIEPHRRGRAWSGSGPAGEYHRGPVGPGRRSGRHRREELLDQPGEDLRPVDVRQVAGPRDDPVGDVRQVAGNALDRPRPTSGEVATRSDRGGEDRPVAAPEPGEGDGPDER